MRENKEVTIEMEKKQLLRDFMGLNANAFENLEQLSRKYELLEWIEIESLSRLTFRQLNILIKHIFILFVFKRHKGPRGGGAHL